MKTEISVKKLNKSFGKLTIIQDISFDLLKGEFVSVIGPSGCGKTTWLYLIQGFIDKTNGKIEVKGKLGFVFQDFQLLTDRNVEKNLSFVLEATGHKNKDENRLKIEEVLARVGMSTAINKRIHRLSGGEQQRISIARAILNNPTLLLADEPTGHLDPEVSLEIMQLFKELNQSGMAIIMASHDYNTMAKVPGQILKCEGGKIFPVSSL